MVYHESYMVYNYIYHSSLWDILACYSICQRIF